MKTANTSYARILWIWYAVLALAWLNAAFRAWTRDTAHWLIAVAVVVALLFLFFAVTQYRKSRKL